MNNARKVEECKREGYHVYALGAMECTMCGITRNLPKKTRKQKKSKRGKP